MNEKSEKIDTNFYSRQIGTFGLNTMTKIIKMNIFIYGMRGVGVEVAKNIVLSGPKSLTIFDPYKSEMRDLTSNFFLNENDIKKGYKRDESCLLELSKLNPYVKIDIMEGNNIVENIKIKNKEHLKYDVIVITEFLPKKLIIEIDELCRQNEIGLIFACELGIYGFFFVDFGNEFIIYDKTGEEPKEYLINSITKEKNGKVFINTNLSGKVNFTCNDLVSFKEIQGMTELNNCKPRSIKITNDIIEIGDTSEFSDYISGGIIFNVKSPEKIKFESFKERVENPYKEGEEYKDPLDFLNVNIQEILHIGILSLFSFYDKMNCLPEINSLKDADFLFEIAKNILTQKEEENIYWVKNIRNNIEEYDMDFDIIFEKTIKNLSKWARTEVSPISSFIGGVVAQEIIKFSGKYQPIHQWLWLDFSQIVENLNIDIDRTLKNSRYDDQIAIFGQEIQKKIENTNIFMIGAGALGCEFLKTFAMMGIATDKNKKLIVTDDDKIEISNLNRQFLFNKESIGKLKSEIACKSIKKMNSFFNCISFQTRVSPENENFFNETFWNEQDYIINAVDNIKARIYIANQCLIYKKILIDSGTLGTKANSQIMIPHKTIPYSPPEEKEEKQIPVCTLVDHPFTIVHCIEWAKDNFNGYFVDILKEVKMLFENREKFYNYLKVQYVPSEQLQKIKQIWEYAKITIEKNFEKCVEIGLNQYNKNFNLNILYLISQHGEDSLTKEGTKFWSGDKRFPHPLPFNNENKLAILFVKKYAQILASNLSIPIIDENDKLIDIISKIKLDEYIPQNINDNKKIPNYKKKMNKEEKLKQRQIVIEKVETIKKEINIWLDSFSNNINKDLIRIEELDIDNQENGHIDFIYAFTNLRAENYNIEKCELTKVKMIAGKIVPAIASTTAAIVGIVSLQLYVLSQTHNIQFLRNCYFDLSRNIICFENIRKSKKMEDGNDKIDNIKKKFKLVPESYTIWDYLIINESLTFTQFIEYIKKQFNVCITSITSNGINLYLKDLTSDDVLNKKIEEFYNEISNIKLPENKKYLMLEIDGDINDFYAKMPLFKYNFK